MSILERQFTRSLDPRIYVKGEGLSLINARVQALQKLNAPVQFDGSVWRIIEDEDEEEDYVIDETAFAEEFERQKKVVCLERVRLKRNILLQECDHYIFPDYPIAEEVKQQWIEYRQALRDITVTEPLPSMDDDGYLRVSWPTKPTN